MHMVAGLVSFFLIAFVSHVGSTAFTPPPSFLSSWYRDLLNVFRNYNENIIDEIKFRQASFYQYHDQIKGKIHTMIDQFTDQQIQQRNHLEKELNDYLIKFQNFSIQLNQQLKEKPEYLNKELQILKNKYQRPQIFDKSLEDFQKAFNESVIIQTFFPTFNLPPSRKEFKRPVPLIPPFKERIAKPASPSSTLFTLPSIFQIQRKLWEWTTGRTITPLEDPFSEQFNLLNDQFTTSLNQLKEFSTENRLKSERFIKKTIKDLNQYKENLLLQSKTLEKVTLEKIPKALTKEDIRKTRDLIEKNLEKLEKDSLQWFEMKKNELDQTLRLFQEKLNMNENIYEELLGKKKASIHYTIMNDITLKKVLNMIDPNDQGIV